MFDLGLTLKPSDFVLIAKRPGAMVTGLFGQLILLPAIAWCLVPIFQLPPIFFIGIMLIACCPGGSSSNVFSMLAKGDVALSVSLTAVSSIVTLFTVPLILQWTTTYIGTAVGVQLPVGNLLMQNLVTMLLPIVLGILCRRYFDKAAMKIERVL